MATLAHRRFRSFFACGDFESWFSKLTQQRLQRGAFSSVQELVAAIKDYLKHYNADPNPFVWSTSVDTILKKVGTCKVIRGTHNSRS